MIKDWYKHWFLSDEYLDVYGHRNNDDAQQFINLVLNHIDIPGTSVLDAACGAGRHSIALAKKGFNVTAFDLSRMLLSVAIKNTLLEKVRIKYFNADLRDVVLKTRFDLIINAFTSFGYFETDEENFSFIKNSRNMLHENGKFVFDYFNSVYLELNLLPYSERRIEDKTIIEKRRISNNRVIKEIEIINGGVTKNFLESVKIYSPNQLLEKFEYFGFRILEKYGSYAGEPFDMNNSERIILVCGKI